MSGEWYEGLTEKQRKFCEAYAGNGGNAYQAAIKAGYGRPRQEGARALENAGIVGALEALRKATTSAAIATREERQSFWTTVLRDKDSSMRDRLKASDLLGRSQADFIDRKEISGQNGGPVVLQLGGKSIKPEDLGWV